MRDQRDGAWHFIAETPRDGLRIGLREIRALGPRGEIGDAAVSGFGAHRLTGEAVSYVLMYCTWEGWKELYQAAGQSDIGEIRLTESFLFLAKRFGKMHAYDQ